MPPHATSAPPSAGVLALFDDLLELPPTSPDKPSLAENLLDVLEVCAVAAGLKTCHLHGDGFRDPDRLAAIATIAHRHGLHTRRTPRCRPLEARPSRLAPVVQAHLNELGDARRAAAPEVLWVYREPDIARQIDAAVAGQTDLGDLLGYPHCCATAHAETSQRWLESYVGALQAQHHTTDMEQLLQLLASDAPVDPAHLPPPAAPEPSGSVFPFVSFDACSACLSQADSAAEKAQAPLRDLAFALAAPFALHLWQAQLAEAGAAAPTLETPCPCGSGQACGHCCGASPEPVCMVVHPDTP